MDDRVSATPRQNPANSAGDRDRLNVRPPQPRRALYSRASVAGTGMPADSVPESFAQALMEAAEALIPDVQEENRRRSLGQLLSQTAIMNLMATAPNNLAALQPAVLGYATHIANQVQLESNAPVRFKPGERFRDRDNIDGHFRVPPTNETRSSREVQ